MPMYEYACKLCNHQFEKLQKISDDPLVSCPECNKDGLKKLVSKSGFRLKGDGWYETDFKGAKDTKRNLHETRTSSSKDSSSSSE